MNFVSAKWRSQKPDAYKKRLESTCVTRAGYDVRQAVMGGSICIRSGNWGRGERGDGSSGDYNTYSTIAQLGEAIDQASIVLYCKYYNVETDTG